MAKYEIVMWKEDGTWTAHAPSIPGAYGVGKTSSRAEEDLQEALDLLEDYLGDVGERLPPPRRLKFGTVTV